MNLSTKINNKENVIAARNCTLTIDAINFYLILIGIIGNTICIGIFLHRNLRKHKYNLYLLVLSTVELFFCVLAFISYICYIMPIKSSNFADFRVEFASHFVDSFSVAIRLILLIDRLFAIDRPIAVKSVITKKQPKLLISCAFIITFIIRIPELVFSYMQKHFLIICFTIISNIILNMLPAIVILILNIMLFRIIKKHDNMKQKSSPSSIIYQRKVTKSDENNNNNNETVDESEKTNENIASSKIINYKPMTNKQKSHFIFIVALGAYFLCTTIPYYITFYICLLNNCHSNLQYITSILFNSNHCINMFICVAFHYEFRLCLLKCMSNIWPTSVLVSGCYDRDRDRFDSIDMSDSNRNGGGRTASNRRRSFDSENVNTI